MLAIGASLYAWEVGRYFRWIDERCPNRPWLRAGMAMGYFNPLWISRHMAFILILSGRGAELSWGLLLVGLKSFLGAVPASVAGNYLIQNRLRFEWRFAASATFSGLMAVYYALSELWLRR